MLIVIIRTLLIYIIAITAVRLMGKRQVGDMQTSDLVTTLIISEVVSLPMENPAQPLLLGIVPVMILVAVEIVLSIVMMRHRKIRSLVCGHPIVVIKDGEILKSQLDRLRISFEDLYSLLRQHDVFDVADIRYGIIEPNGSLSVLKNDDSDLEIISSPALKEELGSLKEESS